MFEAKKFRKLIESSLENISDMPKDGLAVILSCAKGEKISTKKKLVEVLTKFSKEYRSLPIPHDAYDEPVRKYYASLAKIVDEHLPENN